MRLALLLGCTVWRSRRGSPAQQARRVRWRQEARDHQGGEVVGLVVRRHDAGGAPVPARRVLELLDDPAHVLVDEALARGLECALRRSRSARVSAGMITSSKVAPRRAPRRLLDLGGVLVIERHQALVETLLGRRAPARRRADRLRYPSSGIYRPITATQTVSGVASRSPTGPHSQVQKITARMTAIGERPALLP